MCFFSIIIPTYNRIDFIENTLNSILSQSFKDFEIIIIDDGSTDNTKELIESKYLFNNQIKYIYQLNTERGAARNHGFNISKGKYVIFFDSDDWMYPNHLSILHEVIHLNPNIRFLSTKYSYLDNGKIKPSSSLSLIEGWHSGEIYLRGGVTGIMICILKNNFKLKPFLEDRAYSTLEDWVYLVQNLLHDQIYIVDKISVLVNDHPARSMRADNLKIIKKRLIATDWIINNVKLNSKQQNLLLGHSYYFCAIHSYLDNSKLKSVQYLWKSILRIGINRSILLLLIKSLLGRNFINLINKKNMQLL